MLLTYTKIPDAVYSHKRLVYEVVCSEATVNVASEDQGGGVAMVSRE